MAEELFTNEDHLLFNKIATDIKNNPAKYCEAGKWLDEYKNQEKVYHIIKRKCKAIVDSNFKREDWQESPNFIMPDSVLEICKALQAVAMVDMGFFPDLEVLISKYQKEADSIPNNFQPMSERIATRAKIGDFLKKIYPTNQYQQGLICDHECLYTACEDLLEINDKLGLIDKETKLKICLLTWLITNPDADKAGLNITEFEKTRWELNCGNEIIPHRAKVIQILNTCGMLSQWQALACKASEINFGGKAGDTEQNATPAKGWRRIGTWLKRHPHSYGLTGGVIFLVLFFVLGLFKIQWRYWCWGTAGIAFLVLILSLLGGRSSR